MHCSLNYITGLIVSFSKCCMKIYNCLYINGEESQRVILVFLDIKRFENPAVVTVVRYFAETVVDVVLCCRRYVCSCMCV